MEDKIVLFCEIEDCRRNKARECELAKKSVLSTDKCAHRAFKIRSKKTRKSDSRTEEHFGDELPDLI